MPGKYLLWLNADWLVKALGGLQWHGLLTFLWKGINAWNSALSTTNGNLQAAPAGNVCVMVTIAELGRGQQEKSGSNIYCRIATGKGSPAQNTGGRSTWRWSFSLSLLSLRRVGIWEEDCLLWEYALWLLQMLICYCELRAAGLNQPLNVRSAFWICRFFFYPKLFRKTSHF